VTLPIIKYLDSICEQQSERGRMAISSNLEGISVLGIINEWPPPVKQQSHRSNGYIFDGVNIPDFCSPRKKSGSVFLRSLRAAILSNNGDVEPDRCLVLSMKEEKKSVEIVHQLHHDLNSFEYS